jgi:hypothetical protein
MKGIEETAGKTAMGTTDMIKTVVETIVSLLISTGASFKKINGEIDRKELKKFVETLFAISSVGMYQTFIVVKGVSYPIEAYKVDSRIAEAFVQPRAIVMPGTSPFRKDVSAHFDAPEMLDPAAFEEFQYKFMNYFKTVPSFGNMLEAIKVVNLGEVVDCISSDGVHVEDLASTKKIPYILKDASVFYGDGYFNYTVQDVVKFVVLNFYTSLK